MKEIIEAIDTATATSLGEPCKFYGLCQQTIDDQEGNYPRTLADKPEKVTPNDKHELAIYHRLLNGSIAEDGDLSFGRSKTKKNNQTIRTIVIIHDKCRIFIEDIINALPEKLTITDYQTVYVSSEISLNTNQDQIWVDEWAEAYKKYQVRYRIYALEYIVEYIKC
jgi:hypothetical protein